jgi:hypothetical protein
MIGADDTRGQTLVMTLWPSAQGVQAGKWMHPGPAAAGDTVCTAVETGTHKQHVMVGTDLGVGESAWHTAVAPNQRAA